MVRDPTSPTGRPKRRRHAAERNGRAIRRSGPPARVGIVARLLLCAGLLAACGPRAHIPPRPTPNVALPGVVPPTDSAARLARALSPELYLQRDEWFQLERVVAVMHPTKRIVAYYLLWRDDVNGSWIPFTVPTDEEVVWVGYDAAGAPEELWTYWHGTLLHTPWRDRGRPAIAVQWGKHGSLPYGIIESDLPRFKTLNSFYASTWIGLPDIWLGRLTRRGPLCFCHGYGRYREFTRHLDLADRLDVVAVTENPDAVLGAVFGRPYSRKGPWPGEGRKSDGGKGGKGGR